MRQIYTSPRHENIDRVVALLAEHGIETTVANRAVYKRPSYNRFSYAARDDSSSWPRVEVSRADDLTRARAILREIGLEPATRHAEILAAVRQPGPAPRANRDATVRRVRIAALAAVAAAFLVMVLKAMQIF